MTSSQAMFVKKINNIAHIGLVFKNCHLGQLCINENVKLHCSSWANEFGL